MRTVCDAAHDDADATCIRQQNVVAYTRLVGKTWSAWVRVPCTTSHELMLLGSSRVAEGSNDRRRGVSAVVTTVQRQAGEPACFSRSTSPSLWLPLGDANRGMLLLLCPTRNNDGPLSASSVVLDPGITGIRTWHHSARGGVAWTGSDRLDHPPTPPLQTCPKHRSCVICPADRVALRTTYSSPCRLCRVVPATSVAMSATTPRFAPRLSASATTASSQVRALPLAWRPPVLTCM